jgi:hypothetical protein
MINTMRRISTNTPTPIYMTLIYPSEDSTETRRVASKREDIAVIKETAARRR